MGYKFTTPHEKINHLMCVNNSTLFAKNEKELDILIQRIKIYSLDIGMEFGIEKCNMLVMKNGKRQITERIELPNQEKIRTLREKETYKYSRILEADTIKHAEMKEDFFKRPHTNEKTARKQTLQ